MKTIAFSLVIALSGLLLAATTASAADPIQLKPGVKQQLNPQLKPQMQPQIKPGIVRGNACPDPAVELRLGWPRRNADGTYTFHLLAIIKNQGQARFHSNRSQTKITLYEGHTVRKSGVWASRAYSTVTLEPGQGASENVVIQNWNPNSEFLADFSAQISYDPDIRTDGNPENDDCNMGNNSARISVAEAKRILASSAR